MTHSNEIPAIDVHGHYGPYRRGRSELLDHWSSATAGEVADRANTAGIRRTIVSPLAGLLPRGQADAVAANEAAARDVADLGGLLLWVIVHPLQPRTYEQAAEMLLDPRCVGIKLHPEEHEYPIREHGRELFEFAARHDAIVLAHSGDENSWPRDFLPWIDAHANVRLILAHLGNGGGAAGDPTLQVRAIQASRHGNVFVDTSSARSILPGLIEWAVREVGADCILFGTDTPLYSVAMQRARIDSAAISGAQRCQILLENAERLLGIDAQC